MFTAVLAAGSVRADTVTEWNEIAGQTLLGPPPITIRHHAVVQLAVHDALKAISPRYASQQG
ncbi:MAG: hypothetical protein LKM32_03630 [Chiayiivirga sp.]|uniref:hypothetical protein n=1 Tax=Chiayiivirga sp. TaxID=2041042 RepID=UPI0025BF3C86|nr:hypothetical protein [Chiayiivirga sp.]MCI1728510.1 hypothetical protein [Chiayiivirga sp.]